MSTIAMMFIIICALIIALVLLVLLSPITYSIDVNGRTPYRAELRIRWLWRVFSLHLAYFQGKPFFKQLYLLGMQKIGPVKGYEQWLEQRVEEEYRKAMEDIDDVSFSSQAEAMARAMQGEGQGPVAGRTSGHDPIPPMSGDEPSAGMNLSASVDDDSGEAQIFETVRVEPEPEHGDLSAEARAAHYDAIQEDPLAHLKPDDEVLSKVTFNEDGTVKERIFTKLGTVKANVKDRFKKPDPDDPVANFKSKIPTFWFVTYIKDMELWRQLLLVGRRCYNHSKPRDIFVEGRIGLGDPYRSGILASMLYSIWAEEAQHIDVEYTKFRLEGSGYIKGRIVLGVLAWHGTRFLLAKPVRRFIAAGIRVAWVKRKEKKQLDVLKAQQAE